MRRPGNNVATTVLALGLALVVSPVSSPRAQDSPLVAAMQDEMQRSMTELRMKGEPAPYFIEYEIDDLASMRVVARLGGVVDDLADRGRTLQVQARGVVPAACGTPQAHWAADASPLLRSLSE